VTPKFFAASEARQVNKTNNEGFYAEN